MSVGAVSAGAGNYSSKERLRCHTPLPAALDCRRTSIFLISQLVAVHLPELGSIQRLKHVADQNAFSSSFQILAADPCLGCIFSTLQRQAPRLVLTNRTRHNIAVSYMLIFSLSQKGKARPATRNRPCSAQGIKSCAWA